VELPSKTNSKFTDHKENEVKPISDLPINIAIGKV
jgi:hypothetical protein